MKIQGDNRDFLNEASIQSIKREEFGQGESFDILFNMLDTNVKGDGILDSKEVKKALSIFSKIGNKNSYGNDNTIEDTEISEAIISKSFKNENIKEQDLKAFISKLFELNDAKAKQDFAQTKNMQSLDSNPSIAFNKDNKPVLIYNNQMNKNGKSLSTFRDRLSVDKETGYYEVPYDLKNSKGEVVYKSGFYDNENNRISYGYNGTEQGYENTKKYAHLHGFMETEHKDVFTKNGKQYVYVPENHWFYPIDNIIDSDENGSFVHVKFNRHYDSNVESFNIGFYNNTVYRSEAEYYIIKNNLNIEIKKDGNTTTYVDKNDPSIIYTYEGRGIFGIDKSTKIGQTKKLKANGELDEPIYQAGVGDCYLVSVMQGIRKYMPNTFKQSGVIKLQDNEYQVTFPGIKNPEFGTKKTYTVPKSEVTEDINKEGDDSALGDPDAIIVENAYENFRLDVIQYLEKHPKYSRMTPYRASNSFGLMLRDNSKQEYSLTRESIEASRHRGEPNQEYKILDGGNQFNVLKLLLPPGTKIKTINTNSENPASKIIDEYSSNGYVVFASYQVKQSLYSGDQSGHGVVYDNEAKQFISTYHSETVDNELLTENDRNSKIYSITVVKIPDADLKTK